MRRRDILCAPLSILASPTGAFAQAPRQPRKIGYLHLRSIAPNQTTLVILKQAWQKLGYVEGETVLLRAADSDARRVPALVTELIDLGAGVLIVVGASAVVAASQTTQTVPIVGVDLALDPVRARFASSLRHPGGNVTGLFMNQAGIVGKIVDLLREAAPDIERIAFLSDAGTGEYQLQVGMEVARAKGLEVVVLESGPTRTFDEVLHGISGKPKTAIAQLSTSAFTLADAANVAAAVQKYQLPMIAQLKSWLIPSGALMSYGPILENYFPRAVILADRLLKGDKPGELPIEGPDRFELIINLKVAKAIGVAISRTLLLQADAVIQ